MAIMIPDLPRDYDQLSQEGEIFEALKTLSDEYYVIHSFKRVFVADNTLHEGETDFVIFNPQHGVICIEAKAGAVKYRNGQWLYASDKVMKHGGPYNQASKNKWDFLDMIQRSTLSDIQYRIKLLHAVWFPGVKMTDLNSERFPAEVNKDITLTADDLISPEEKIRHIFSLDIPGNIKTNLSKNETRRIIREIICPEFNIFPSNGFDNELKKITFCRLLNEQKNVLKYLIEQRSAVINGAAGTGKTMIAVEKATGHAKKGEKVLFLCYNTFLKEHLNKEYHHENIDYMTLDGFACKICDSSVADYSRAKDKIEDMFIDSCFPYYHVIVDEGQDFGNEKIEETDILKCIYETVTENEKGSFYVFYDKLQLVQSKDIPSFISEADCKLTLYKNCRNTENIAKTSLKPITERKPELYEGTVPGKPARMFFVNGQDLICEKIEKIIDELDNDGIKDTVILTCATENNSVLAPFVKDGKFKKKRFTTCRKFKGLEADAVILIDVNADTFKPENIMRYYVGASRARIRLEIVTQMSDEECTLVLKNNLKCSDAIRRPNLKLATELNATPVIR